MSETTQQDYKYPLTRICLREGQMTLTRRLLEIFPSDGTITLEDSETGETMQAHMSDSRTVKGLGDFYKRYHLNVNDRLLLRKHADILTVTPMRKKRQNDYSSPEAVNHILDYIADNNTPLSEAEIRDIFPDLPITIDLAALLKEDGRFMRGEGRWRLAPATSPVREAAPIKIDEAVIANPFPFVEEKKERTEEVAGDRRRPIIKGSEWRKQHHVEKEESHTDTAQVIDGVDARLGIALNENEAAEVHSEGYAALSQQDAFTNYAAQTKPEQLPSSLHSFHLEASDFMAASQPSSKDSHDSAGNYPAAYASTDYTATGYTPEEVQDSNYYEGEALLDSVASSTTVSEAAIPEATTSTPAQAAPQSSRQSPVQPSTSMLEPDMAPTATTKLAATEHNAVIFPGDQGLRSLEPEMKDVASNLSQRVMWVLSQVGYTLEPIQHFGYEGETQQLLAHAPLGKSQEYSALIHLHPSHARLDWAGLLAKRRETGADYLSVFGDAEDLQRLHSPAELARATLWSWKGLERLESASQALALSPMDLEPYFARHGIFEYGLEHFQKTTEQRISERGHLSAVLRHLAKLDAPCVFTLSDIQAKSKLQISNDYLLNIMQTLIQPPFEVVIALEEDSYSLRQPIIQALTSLSDYANSLKAHITRQVAKASPARAAEHKDINTKLSSTVANTNDEVILNTSRLSA